MKINIPFFPSILICFMLAGCGPSTFEDCVLQNLKGINNEDVMMVVTQACRKKFPSKDVPSKCSKKILSPSEYSKITGTATITNLGKPYFSVDLYNGLEDMSIADISVSITSENIIPPQEYSLYLKDPIEPKSAGSAGVTVQTYPTKNFGWKYVSIKVCQK